MNRTHQPVASALAGAGLALLLSTSSSLAQTTQQNIDALVNRGICGKNLQNLAMTRCNGIMAWNRPYMGDGVKDCYGYTRQVWNAILYDGKVHSEDFSNYDYTKANAWLAIAGGLPVNTGPSDPNWASISSLGGVGKLLPGDVCGTTQGHEWGMSVHYGMYAGVSGGQYMCYQCGGGYDGAYYTPFYSGWAYYYKPIHAALAASGGGGDVSLKPSSLIYPAGNEEVFAIDSQSDGVWHAFNSGYGNPWSSGYLDGFACASALAPVCHGGMMEIFGIGLGGYLQHNWNQGASTPWNGWSVLQAGSFVGNPAAIGRSGGGLTVMVHNDNGGTMQEFHQAGTSQPWYTLDLGGTIASDVALVELSNGYVQAFATDTSGFLVNRWDTGPGTAWNNGGWVRIGSGGLEGRPCAVRRPDGGVELFIRKASDHSVTHVYHKLFTDPWTINSLGGAIASNPCGIAYANNGVEIFAITANGQLWHNWNTGGGTAWNGWAGPLAVGCTSDPCVHLNGTANTEVFYRGANSGQIWHTSRAVNGSWSTSASLGDQ